MKNKHIQKVCMAFQLAYLGKISNQQYQQPTTNQQPYPNTPNNFYATLSLHASRPLATIYSTFTGK
jgi:hypothetical protein